MGQIKGYSCDECGVTRGPSNHWWVVEVSNYILTIEPMPAGQYQMEAKEKCFCGRECTQKQVEKFLEAAGK